MPSVCLYFQVHQPFRIKPYSFTGIGRDHLYENETLNREILRRVAEHCYLPVNHLLLKLIAQHKGQFKIAFSVSGTALEQFEKYEPVVLASFKALAQTGCAEFLAETYYHSLSFLYSQAEFDRQVNLHAQQLQRLLGVKARVFRHTELIYSDQLAEYVTHKYDFKGLIAEGVDHLLQGRSPDHVYIPASESGYRYGKDDTRLLLKNYRLSDDIAFRFTHAGPGNTPLTAPYFAAQIAGQTQADTVNLFMDYETFGEHHRYESGILDFLEQLPQAILGQKLPFCTPTETLAAHPPKGSYASPQFTSWADEARDLSAWLENNMQRDAIARLYALETPVKRLNDRNLLNIWAKLTTSDHFYYMSTKYMNDGAVHQYFSPFSSPYDAYIYYMNILSDLTLSIERATQKQLTGGKKKRGKKTTA